MARYTKASENISWNFKHVEMQVWIHKDFCLIVVCGWWFPKKAEFTRLSGLWKVKIGGDLIPAVMSFAFFVKIAIYWKHKIPAWKNVATFGRKKNLSGDIKRYPTKRKRKKEILEKSW